MINKKISLQGDAREKTIILIQCPEKISGSLPEVSGLLIQDFRKWRIEEKRRVTCRTVRVRPENPAYLVW
jgi:hypothetical protein